VRRRGWRRRRGGERKRGGEERRGRRREGGLSGNVVDEAFCLKSAHVCLIKQAEL